MRSALYYPYANISNEAILKTGLILWDQLEFISPWDGYMQREFSLEDARAKELIVRPLIPSNTVKKTVHERVEQLVNSGLPEWFWIVPEKQNEAYEMYPDKILFETWQLLLDARYAKPKRADNSHRGFLMSQDVGMTLMSILADECSGKEKKCVTDKPAAYAALNKFITRHKNGCPAKLLGTSAEIDLAQDMGFGQLVNITLKTLNLENISLKTLVDLREREEKDGGAGLTILRNKYFEKLDAVTRELANEQNSEGDYLEILRTFESDTEADFKALKRELNLSVADALLTTDVLTWVLVPAGLSTAILGPVGAVASVLGVYKAVRNMASARKKALAQHPTSWLYQAKPHPTATTLSTTLL